MKKERKKPELRKTYRVTVRLTAQQYNKAKMRAGIYVQGGSERGKMAKWCRHGIVNAPARYLK